MFSWTMSEGGELDARPVRAFLPRAGLQVDESAWPASVPAMAQLLREGLEVPAGLTVLVGENGSGKSTVIESLAEAYGLNPQGGSAQARLFRVRRSEPGACAEGDGRRDDSEEKVTVELVAFSPGRNTETNFYLEAPATGRQIHAAAAG